MAVGLSDVYMPNVMVSAIPGPTKITHNIVMVNKFTIKTFFLILSSLSRQIALSGFLNRVLFWDVKLLPFWCSAEAMSRCFSLFNPVLPELQALL
jgi:hypothetical protein